MRNPIRLAILFLAFIPTACLYAQTTATISGSVSDSSGALLKGARLRAKAIDTGATRFSSTAANGRYTFSNLPSGAYEIRAEAPGFRPTVRQGIRVAVGDAAQVDFLLEVG